MLYSSRLAGRAARCSFGAKLALLSLVAFCCEASLSAHSQSFVFAADVAQPPEGVLYEHDLECGKGGKFTLHLDLARPAKQTGPTPCVVVIHGGAWRGGKKEQHTKQIFDLAERGYVAASLQYRLCPKFRFPAQVEDVKCAIRYLRAHAAELQIDPERFGAIGFSAGAHLAMMLGVMDSDDGLEGEGGWAEHSSKVQVAVSFAGPTFLPAKDLTPAAIVLVNDFIGATIEDKPDAYLLASPQKYATADDSPMLLFQGTKDPLVPYTQAVIMAETLSKVGVPGRVEMLIGAGHGWGGIDKRRSFEAMHAFLDRYLREVK